MNCLVLLFTFCLLGYDVFALDCNVNCNGNSKSLQNAFDEYVQDTTTQDAIIAECGPLADWDVSECTDLARLSDNVNEYTRQHFNGDLTNWDGMFM